MSNSAVASLPARVKNCQLTARMLGKEIGHIENTSVQDDPDISFLGVFSNFFHRVVTGCLFLFLGWCSGCGIHRMFV